MFRVVIRYNDFLGDGRKVFNTISQMNIPVLETARPPGVHPEITLLMYDRVELNQLIMTLNRICHDEVSIVKLMTGCSRCDCCKCRDNCTSIRRKIFSLLPFSPKCYKSI